jgi:predicted amidophosphoribosyltransferase
VIDEMPDENCRNCGGNLTRYALCSECKGIMQKICIKCGEKTLEQFHLRCFYYIESTIKESIG